MNSFFTPHMQDPNDSTFGPLGIIAMPGCEEMGAKINQWLIDFRDEREISEDFYYTVPGRNRDSYLIQATCPRFGTGEGKGMLKESVRGYDIYIIVDVCAYNKTYKMYGREVQMSPDEHYQDLKRIIAAIGGKAKRVNVIMPMLYEGRQHRRTTRESLDCALALQELQGMGITNLITFDAHDPRVQNAIPLCGFENVQPTYQMIKTLFREVKDLNISKENMLVVSPDEGAAQRNIFYASMLSLNMGMFYKRRDYTCIVNGSNPIIAHEYLGESVEGKDVIVVDDILSSGDSILDLARILKEKKAKRIFAVVTFAFFTNGLSKFEEAYKRGEISKVFATNLNFTPEETLKAKWFGQADLSKYMAYIIATLNHDRSLHNLLNPSDRIHKAIEKYKNEQKKNGLRLV